MKNEKASCARLEGMVSWKNAKTSEGGGKRIECEWLLELISLSQSQVEFTKSHTAHSSLVND